MKRQALYAKGRLLLLSPHGSVLFAHRFDEFCIDAVTVTVSRECAKPAGVLAKKEQPNTALQLTNTDAAQSAILSLCLLSVLAAECHVGQAKQPQIMASPCEQ